MHKYYKVTDIFKALSDDTRIEIVRHVMLEKEISCQELMKRFPLSQPTMSHHFNKLVYAGVLNNRKGGVLWFYMLNFKYLQSLGIDIEKIVEHTNEDLREEVKNNYVLQLRMPNT